MEMLYTCATYLTALVSAFLLIGGTVGGRIQKMRVLHDAKPAFHHGANNPTRTLGSAVYETAGMASTACYDAV